MVDIVSTLGRLEFKLALSRSNIDFVLLCELRQKDFLADGLWLSNALFLEEDASFLLSLLPNLWSRSPWWEKIFKLCKIVRAKLVGVIADDDEEEEAPAS
jgi:hypothetical protein